MSKTLIFLHIPKTAGTTLRSILMRQYSDGKVCLIYNNSPVHISTEEFNAFTDDKKISYEAIMGHLTFGLHHMLPKDRKYTYAAIIRDPVKRVLSLYNHLVNNQLKDSGHSILDFIADRNAQFDNHQVRILSGKHAPFGKCSEMMLNAAIKNLSDKFSLVGIAEMFEETLFLANKLLGWKAVPYANKNIGKNMPGQVSEVIDDSVINSIKEHNSLDIKLYEYASDLMWEKIRNTGADWEENLRKFKDELASKREEPVLVDGEGNLGKVTSNQIAGWARIKQSDETALVRLLINDTSEIISPANIKRGDLKAKGIHPTGRCGFIFNLPDELQLKPGDNISVKIVGDTKDLSNSPKIYQHQQKEQK